MHDILYCTVHDKFFHGLRPIGMHNRLHTSPHWAGPNWLVNLGPCPFYNAYSIQTQLHKFYIDQLDRVIQQAIDEMKATGKFRVVEKWGNWRTY